MEIRNSSLEDLFEDVKKLGLPLDQKAFEILAKTYDTPEEMALELIAGNERIHASLYPLLCEIWRRLCPEKYTISIFGRELDYLIEQYENATLEQPEDLYQALAQLHNILDENCENGLSPEDAFSIIQEYVDYDLDSFLYIYILNEIETSDGAYAHDLLDAFLPYVQDKIWFDYLMVRVEILEDLEQGYEKLEEFIEIQLKEEENLDLNLEVLLFLAQSGHHTLYLNLALPSISLLDTEEDFLDFADLAKEHFQTLELESLADQVKNVLENRQPRPLNMPFSPEDPDLLQIHKILTQKVLVL